MIVTRADLKKVNTTIKRIMLEPDSAGRKDKLKRLCFLEYTYLHIIH